jgi:hypothetical protein
MKTAEEILKTHCAKLENLTDLLSAFTALRAMEEYAEQFKYDYSQNCKCTDSTGSTWCCNICGKPLDNNSPSNAEAKIIEKMQGMCEQSLSPDTFEKWESVKEWLIKTRGIK